MQNTVRSILNQVSSAVLLGALVISIPGTLIADEAAEIAEGKKIAFDRKKGNCLGCHVAGDGEMPGNIGPPLIAMKARFPDREKLKEQIHDPRIANPNSIMPPFGAHEVLTADELEKVVTFVHSL